MHSLRHLARAPLLKPLWPLAVVCALLTAPIAWGNTLLIANKSAAFVTLYDLTEQRVLNHLPTEEGPHEIALSRDGATAVISNYGTANSPGNSLTVIDIAGAKVKKTIRLPSNSQPHGVAWLDNQHVILTAEGIDSTLIVNVDQGSLEHLIPISQATTHMIAVDTIRERAYTTNIGAGTLSVIDLATRQKIRDITTGAGAEGLALGPEGNTIWVANRSTGTVSIIAADSLSLQQELALPGFPLRALYDPHRQRMLFTLAASDQLASIDIDTLAITLTDVKEPQDTTHKTLLSDRLPNSSIPIGIEITADGQYVFVAHSAAHVISIRDGDTLHKVLSLPSGLEPDGIAWTPVVVVRDPSSIDALTDQVRR
jgi:YVTN family beta-propeller protein